MHFRDDLTAKNLVPAVYREGCKLTSLKLRRCPCRRAFSEEERISCECMQGHKRGTRRRSQPLEYQRRRRTP